MADRYSPSYLAMFRSCPLAACYHYEVGLASMQEGIEGHHRAYGKAGHRGFEHLYKRQYWIRDSLAEAQELFRAAYPVQLDPNDQAKTAETGVAMLAAYVDRWRDVDAEHEILECEELIVNDDWAIRRDLVTRHKPTGAIYGWDHKITGSKDGRYLGQRYWEKFDPDSQITYYIKDIQKKYGACDGFIINAIGMGYRGRRMKDKRTGEMLEVGPWQRFERQVFNRTAEQLQDEDESTATWIERVSTARLNFNFGASAVAAYGFNTANCSYCQYRPLCRAGWTWPRDKEAILCSYRQVCGRVIAAECQTCNGKGGPCSSAQISQINAIECWKRGVSYRIDLAPCVDCGGSGQNTIDAGLRCQLDRDHVGVCRHFVPASRAVGEIEIEVDEDGDE